MRAQAVREYLCHSTTAYPCIVVAHNATSAARFYRMRYNTPRSVDVDVVEYMDIKHFTYEQNATTVAWEPPDIDDDADDGRWFCPKHGWQWDGECECCRCERKANGLNMHGHVILHRHEMRQYFGTASRSTLVAMALHQARQDYGRHAQRRTTYFSKPEPVKTRIPEHAMERNYRR